MPDTLGLCLPAADYRSAPGPALLVELQRERADEARVVAEVAPPQPARLVRQPVGPLQSRRLHPRRRLGHQPGVEVERRADADQHRRLEQRAHLRHPLLLLGHPDSDPHDVGPRMVDLLGDRVPLLRGQRAVRGRVAADDLDPGIALAEVERQLHQRALVAAAVQVEPLTVVGGGGTGLGHQLGSVDAVAERVPERVQRPHQRLTVGDVERGGVQRVSQLAILAGGHHRVHVAHADVAAPALGDHRVDPVERLSIVDQRQRHADDVDRLG